VLIDHTHKPWGIASGVILAVAIVAYIPYALGHTPPSGGSLVGLIYGTVGFGFMAFVTLLALRKKFPIWRIGRTTTWMRGHLWLGALSFPLILMHAGFLRPRRHVGDDVAVRRRLREWLLRRLPAAHDAAPPVARRADGNDL